RDSEDCTGTVTGNRPGTVRTALGIAPGQRGLHWDSDWEPPWESEDSTGTVTGNCPGTVRTALGQ
ncbi:hypothetical protein chiPu_0030711, partial [Chiloscyllium punctatum]|nr:hypothetical protein [Chiloscyllium punctatum]